MGNSSSSTASTADAEAYPEGSGVSLSANLQAQIVKDFNAKIHAEYTQRRKERKRHQKASQEMTIQHAQFLQAAQARQAPLDERMDELSAQFHDTVISADYEASKLQDLYVKQEQILGPESDCADVRNNYVNCQTKQGKDCEIYVHALQDCISKVISDK